MPSNRQNETEQRIPCRYSSSSDIDKYPSKVLTPSDLMKLPQPQLNDSRAAASIRFEAEDNVDASFGLGTVALEYRYRVRDRQEAETVATAICMLLEGAEPLEPDDCEHRAGPQRINEGFHFDPDKAPEETRPSSRGR